MFVFLNATLCALTPGCMVPIPRPPKYFGGLFSVGDTMGHDNVVNFMTGALNCPAAFKPFAVARFIAPEDNCGGVTYLCLNYTGPDPNNEYGGHFQIGDHHPRGSLGNPLVPGAECKCPPGFTDYGMGRHIYPEGDFGAWTHGCFNFKAGGRFGGFYQQADTGAGVSVMNPLTGAPSCPPGYKARAYARVLAGSGAGQYICYQ